MEFFFILAKELGKSVKELFQSMNLYEFQMWQDYYIEYPFGEYRKDLQSAKMIGETLACWSSGGSQFLNDYMLFKDKEVLPSTAEVTAKLQGFLRSC